MTEVADNPEVILTDEQKTFLQMCEEKFADRYTDNDEEFMKLYNTDVSTPPIMENWNQGRNRNFNNRPRNDYHNRRQDNYRDRRDNYNRNYNNSHDRSYNNSYHRRQDSYGRDDRGEKRSYDNRY